MAKQHRGLGPCLVSHNGCSSLQSLLSKCWISRHGVSEWWVCRCELIRPPLCQVSRQGCLGFFKWKNDISRIGSESSVQVSTGMYHPKDPISEGTLSMLSTSFLTYPLVCIEENPAKVSLLCRELQRSCFFLIKYLFQFIEKHYKNISEFFSTTYPHVFLKVRYFKVLVVKFSTQILKPSP